MKNKELRIRIGNQLRLDAAVLLRAAHQLEQGFTSIAHELTQNTITNNLTTLVDITTLKERSRHAE